LAEQVQQVLLPAAIDEFPQRHRHRRLLRALAADGQGAIQEVRVDLEISGRV
jgi:hypothetical protein